jgi:hypothetical protein
VTKPISIDITWHDGAYYVSVPEYKGGTVYTSEYVAGLIDTIARRDEMIDELAKRVYWQTIDTAPSDGREVLVCGSAYKEGAHLREADGEWWRRQAREGSKAVPTHWMEKPTPVMPAAVGAPPK